MMPLFSATNTRPSLANRTAVGYWSPLKTTDSVNPGGSCVLSADRAPLAWQSVSAGGGCRPKRGGGQLAVGAASACDATSVLAPLKPLAQSSAASMARRSVVPTRDERIVTPLPPRATTTGHRLHPWPVAPLAPPSPGAQIRRGSHRVHCAVDRGSAPR